MLFVGCALNQPKVVESATILIKTPKLKFYDKGFITKFENFTEVQILSAGTAVLKLKIYDDRICRDSFKCQSLRVFNSEYLDSNYDENFLKNLFENEQKETIFRDDEHKILIKIKKD